MRICRNCGRSEILCLAFPSCSLNKGKEHSIGWYVGKDKLVMIEPKTGFCASLKSYSEQMEEQLEPRPEPKQRAWDDLDTHLDTHEHTQD